MTTESPTSRWRRPTPSSDQEALRVAESHTPLLREHAAVGRSGSAVNLDGLLRARPLDLTAVRHALQRVPVIEPVDKRISAAIIGVPQ